MNSSLLKPLICFLLWAPSTVLASECHSALSGGPADQALRQLLAESFTSKNDLYTPMICQVNIHRFISRLKQSHVSVEEIEVLVFQFENRLFAPIPAPIKSGLPHQGLRFSSDAFKYHVVLLMHGKVYDPDFSTEPAPIVEYLSQVFPPQLSEGNPHRDTIMKDRWNHIYVKLMPAEEYKRRMDERARERAESLRSRNLPFSHHLREAVTAVVHEQNETTQPLSQLLRGL